MENMFDREEDLLEDVGDFEDDYNELDHPSPEDPDLQITPYDDEELDGRQLAIGLYNSLQESGADLDRFNQQTAQEIALLFKEHDDSQKLITLAMTAAAVLDPELQVDGGLGEEEEDAITATTLAVAGLGLGRVGVDELLEYYQINPGTEGAMAALRKLVEQIQVDPALEELQWRFVDTEEVPDYLRTIQEDQERVKWGEPVDREPFDDIEATDIDDVNIDDDSRSEHILSGIMSDTEREDILRQFRRLDPAQADRLFGASMMLKEKGVTGIDFIKFAAGEFELDLSSEVDLSKFITFATTYDIQLLSGIEVGEGEEEEEEEEAFFDRETNLIEESIVIDDTHYNMGGGPRSFAGQVLREQAREEEANNSSHVTTDETWGEEEEVEPVDSKFTATSDDGTEFRV